MVLVVVVVVVGVDPDISMDWKKLSVTSSEEWRTAGTDTLREGRFDDEGASVSRCSCRQSREKANESEVGPVGFRDGEGRLGLTK